MIELRRLHDFSGFQATSAYFDAFDYAVNQGAHSLKVRVEPAVGPIVGVADGVSELRALAAYIASLRHSLLLQQSNLT